MIGLTVACKSHNPNGVMNVLKGIWKEFGNVCIFVMDKNLFIFAFVSYEIA